MPRWTVEQALAFAPDASSATAGRELASPAKWVNIGQQGDALWGEAKGSGSRPYQTAVDLREPAFKCSCPSRKFPCKHALGLLIRYARGESPESSPPDWVTEWLSKRDDKVKKAADPAPPSEPDPESAARRAAKRWEAILAGLDECEAFLVDVAGQGLLASQSARNWDQMAARMVDAQAPGVARRLRDIGSSVGVGRDWASVAVGRMGALALLIEAGRRVDQLSEAARADVRSALGIAVRREEMNGEKAADTWDVLGEVQEQDDKLTSLRTWLRGRSSGRWAMHLAFSAAGRPFDVRLSPGSAFVGELEFYPSAWPLRAAVDTRVDDSFSPSLGEVWESALDRISAGLSRCPWTEKHPLHLSSARLANEGRGWWVMDGEGQSMRLIGPEPWRLLAMTGNEPAEVMGEWDGMGLRLLSAWGPWGFLSL
jgi:hypothetical protein